MKATRTQIRLVVACAFVVVALTIGLAFWASQDDEDIVAIDEVPEAARAVILKESAAGKLVKVERTRKKGKEVYAAEIIIGEERIELAVAVNGEVVDREAEDLGASDAEEEMLALEDAPQAVQATIRREAKGAEVTELERKTVKGKIIYAAEFTLDGEEIELWVEPDGKVKSRE